MQRNIATARRSRQRVGPDDALAGAGLITTLMRSILSLLQHIGGGMMAAHNGWSKPTVGMVFAFKDSAPYSLAGVPARIVSVWPRFRSGDYLVTLEYATPVQVRNERVSHIDAFISELEPIIEQRSV